MKNLCEPFFFLQPEEGEVGQSSGGVNESKLFTAVVEALLTLRTESAIRSTMIAYILFTVLAILPLFIYWRNPYFLGDLRYAVTAIRIGMRMSKIKKNFSSMLDCFLDRVKKHPEKTFLIFEESAYTYSQADRESNKVARALSTHAQLKEGDTAALFLGNEPQFVWLWLGLAKLGCVASLLNSNVRSKSLVHCFSCCEAKVLIAGAGKLEPLFRGVHLLNLCSFFSYFYFLFLCPIFPRLLFIVT